VLETLTALMSLPQIEQISYKIKFVANTFLNRNCILLVAYVSIFLPLLFFRPLSYLFSVLNYFVTGFVFIVTLGPHGKLQPADL
jgi:hypothetical protein